ncbi:MAG: hypothetical protein QW707_03245 [Candidatus Bathyarchaeia archaeon]
MKEKVKVLCPLGKPPKIRTSALAPRLESLDGKVIYVVDVGFPASEKFLFELVRALREKFSKTVWHVVRKRGTYFDDDPLLWEEIRQKAHAVVMYVGH